MTEHQRRRLRDIDNRAQPFFTKLARFEDKIRDLRERLLDAIDEKRKIEAQLKPLSDEKDKVWEGIFAQKNTKGG